ncbi:MAG: hypothetical protein JWM32_582 [Verrucomicrobia bacterium]|nr:hypothetical protein [Verrucomicrobiota bacterium]
MEIQEPPARSFQLGDVYYTLFRHKWKIIICSLVGFAAAFGYKTFQPPPYQSSAKLFIRYVITEGKSTIGPGKDDSVYKSPDQRGETIISSEVEILSSLDLAQEVAKNVGPEKVLAKISGGKSLNEAAGVIRGGLTVDVPRKSSVIDVTFRHPDADIVQVVLRELVVSYKKKHVEIHRAVGMVGDFLTQETDQLRTRLAQTEEELRKTMNKAGIISLEDFKKTSGEQTAHIRQQIFDAQAELAERSSVLEDYTKRTTGVSAAVDPNAPAVPAEAKPAAIDEYRRVLGRLELARKREQEMLTQFTEENTRVKEVRAQIAEYEAAKAKLEKDSPALARLMVPSTTPTGKTNSEGIDVQAEASRLIALQAKIKALSGQLDQIRADTAKVDQLEVSILELRRRKDLEESNYKYYSASLEQSRINEALGSGRVSNISEIQTATPAYMDWKKPMQIMAGISVAGIVIGLAWAFAIELFLDRSLRRPGDVERILRLPLFLSIPKMKQPRKVNELKGSRRKQPLLTAAAAVANDSGSPSTELALLSSDHQLALDPFYETLRDRLISYFESVNLRHNPKLVAVTGLGQDSGITTIAAGLARSLSQTGEGNVLLVDMTQGQGSAQHFYKGNQSCNIDQLLDARSEARVDSNLYVVGESSNSERLAKGMPQRFTQLVPKLKTSDFDYIIFDMPPVSQISITPRLASFMDMVLMVVEAEKTDRDIAQRATDLLMKSKTHLGVVLNKTKSYVPNKLHQDKGFLLGT